MDSLLLLPQKNGDAVRNLNPYQNASVLCDDCVRYHGLMGSSKDQDLIGMSLQREVDVFFSDSEYPCDLTRISSGVFAGKERRGPPSQYPGEYESVQWSFSEVKAPGNCSVMSDAIREC